MRTKTAVMTGMLILLLASLPVWASGTNPCASLLDAADSREAQPHTENRDLYVRALENCHAAKGELPLELEARVALSRAYFNSTYEKAPAAAVQSLEAALASVTARGGADHPARVSLLEALADAVATKAILELGTEPGFNQRAVELSLEAMALREELYGPKSAEAAQGHTFLANVFQSTAPDVAEDHARRAVEIGHNLDGDDLETVFEALSTLAEVQRSQGKVDEAKETQKMVTKVIRRMESQNV